MKYPTFLTAVILSAACVPGGEHIDIELIYDVGGNAAYNCTPESDNAFHIDSQFGCQSSEGVDRVDLSVKYEGDETHIWYRHVQSSSGVDASCLLIVSSVKESGSLNGLKAAGDYECAETITGSWRVTPDDWTASTDEWEFD